MTANIRFEDWEAEQMRDPEFRAAAEELEPAYQVARMRMMRGLTQEELARLVGTRQPSIARLESGRRQPRLSFLRRIAIALRAQLVVQLVPEEDLMSSDDKAEIQESADEVLPTEFGEELLPLWSADPESSPRIVVDGIETKVRAVFIDETGAHHVEELVLESDLPPSGLIPWIDHAQEAPGLER
jgi:transcriptional regulator with XRE-family HTH domain